MSKRSRLSEQQFQINTQFNDDVADLKTQVLFLSQGLAAMMELVDGMVDKLSRRKVFSEEEDLLRRYRKSMKTLKQAGLRLIPPEDPDAEVRKVTCPNCQAAIRARSGQPIERCDWCGHEFDDPI